MTDKIYLFLGRDKLQEIPFPPTSEFLGDFEGFIFAELRKDWTLSSMSLQAGTVVSLPLASISNQNWEKDLEVLYVPDASSTFSSLSFSKDYMYSETMHNIQT